MKKAFTQLLTLLLMNLLTENLIAQNVGIGTTSPQAKLEVKNPVKSVVKIRSNSFNDTTQLIFSNRTNTEEGTDFIISSNQENGLKISSASDLSDTNDSILVLRRDGKIGINKNIPSEKLDVRGNINLTGSLKINGSSGNTGQVLTSNGASAPTWQTTSLPQIGFTARGTAPAVSNHQDIPNNAETKVTIFNVEEIDNGGLYNPVTARATVSSDGLYHIDISIDYVGADAGLYDLTFHRLNSSGTFVEFGRSARHTVASGAFNQEFQLIISADFYLLANESIEVFTFQNSGAVQQITGSSFSWFNMHKVY